jgi:hypothetical protein
VKVSTPWALIALGATLLLLGFLALLLMVIQVVSASLTLSSLAYAASFAGLVLGLSGLIRQARS